MNGLSNHQNEFGEAVKELFISMIFLSYLNKSIGKKNIKQLSFVINRKEMINPFYPKKCECLNWGRKRKRVSVANRVRKRMKLIKNKNWRTKKIKITRAWCMRAFLWKANEEIRITAFSVLQNKLNLTFQTMYYDTRFLKMVMAKIKVLPPSFLFRFLLLLVHKVLTLKT